jgi:hypothetical protein
MQSPLGNALDASDLDAVHSRASQAPDCEREPAIAEHRPDGAAGDDALERLESSVQWLKRECMIARIETAPSARETIRRLPRASQLPPASEIPAAVRAEGSPHKLGTSTFQLRPPLAFERLQPLPRVREPRARLPGALFVLIAGAVAGSIAYHVAAGGVCPAPEPAQAASLQAQ